MNTYSGSHSIDQHTQNKRKYDNDTRDSSYLKTISIFASSGSKRRERNQNSHTNSQTDTFTCNTTVHRSDQQLNTPKEQQQQQQQQYGSNPRETTGALQKLIGPKNELQTFLSIFSWIPPCSRRKIHSPSSPS